MQRRHIIQFGALLPIPASLWGQEQKREKKLPLPGTQFQVEGANAFLIAPEKSQIQPKPWVWYAPTLLPYPGPEEKLMIEKFLAAGIAMGGIDVGESYGSPAGRAKFTAFYNEMTSKRGYSGKPALLGRSRGGLMLYNWAAEHPGSVGCIAGIYPVCNLSSWPGLEKSAPAYGFTAEKLKSQLANHNPVDRLAPLAKAGVPIFHIHGDSDTVVPLEANSGTVASRYKELGGKMTLVVPKGQGHNMWRGFFECQELVDFIINHLTKQKA